MIPWFRSASVVLLAMLAAVRPCLAAEGMGSGRGAIGGQIGGSFFWGTGDYSEGAKARPAFSGHFRYVMGSHFRWQVSPGFTWSGYSASVPMPVPDGHFPGDVTKNTNLTLFLPVSFQLQYLVHSKKWHYHAGIGPGVYRVWIQNRRIVLVDPVTFNRHRDLSAGFTAQVGVERFIRSLPSTSVEACLASHWVFTEGEDTFPVGYNTPLRVAELRIGASYYFDMSRLKGRPKPPPLPPSSR